MVGAAPFTMLRMVPLPTMWGGVTSVRGGFDVRLAEAYPSPDMTSRFTTADAANAPARAMTACALMAMTLKIMTDPSGPELCRAT